MKQPKRRRLTFHQTAPLYFFFGGNSEALKNGNVEYCEASGAHGGDIFEVTQSSNPQVVWHMQTLIDAQSLFPYVYRGERIPSFYPGVQW